MATTDPQRKPNPSDEEKGRPRHDEAPAEGSQASLERDRNLHTTDLARVSSDVPADSTGIAPPAGPDIPPQQQEPPQVTPAVPEPANHAPAQLTQPVAPAATQVNNSPQAGTGKESPQAVRQPDSTASLAPPTLPQVPPRTPAQAGPGRPPQSSPAPQSDTSGRRPSAPSVPPPAPEWKTLEPKDQSDPVPHEICELVGWKHWHVMSASLRGKLHAHKGLWRDDAYALEQTNDWAIIALSDGAGSARYARVAARIACNEAATTLKKLLTDFSLAPCDADRPADPDLARLKTFLVDATHKARLALIREAQARRCDLRDLHATLLLLIHGPFKDRDLAAAIQVGDGVVGLYTADENHTLLGVPDHGQYSSETCFLTTPHIEHSFGSRVVFSIKKGVCAIAVMCDGVSDDFFPEDKRLIELFVGSPILDLRTRTGDKVWGLVHKDKGAVLDPRDGRALLDWLRYEKRGSSDDRTLVLLYRSPKS